MNQFNSLVNTYGAENASISKPETNPHLIGKSPTEYLLYTIKSIPANDLEQALLTISFTNVLILLRYLDEWIQKVFISLSPRFLIDFFNLIKNNNIIIGMECGIELQMFIFHDEDVSISIDNE